MNAFNFQIPIVICINFAVSTSFLLAIINYFVSADGNAAQICPDGCVCAPLASDTNIITSITCSCKNELVAIRATPSTPLVTIPLGGDYPNDNEARSEISEYHATGSPIISFQSNLYFPADSFALQGAHIERIIVHGCNKVTIARWAFRNAEITEQLKFAGIARLTVEAHAFSAFRRSPTQIVIQDSYIDEIAAHAFAGLSDVEHFWWRNVTIERIAKLAFFKLSNIGYFYFRDVAIHDIENGAFAHIRRIRHLFMRQNILLRHVGDFFLLNAKVDEIIIEGARLNMTALSFLGMRARRISIRDSALLTYSRKISNESNMKKRIPYQQINELNMYNVTIDSIFLSHFYNISTVLFENSQIGDLQNFRADNGLNELVPFTFGEITFRSCRVSRWLSHALSETHEIKSLIIMNTQILFIARSAIYNSRIHNFVVTQTRLKSVSTNAFSSGKFDRVEFDGVEIGSLSDAFLYRSHLEEFSFRNSRINAADDRTFADIAECKTCEITACSFANFPSNMFDNSSIRSIAIRDSEFEGEFKASAFASLHAYQLLVTRSNFLCNPTSCEDNALLLHETIHDNVAWIFTSNKCNPQRHWVLSTTTTLEDKSDEESITLDDMEYPLLTSSQTALVLNGKDTVPQNICTEELETITQLPNVGIICRRRALIEECICVQTPKSDENSRSEEKFVHLPNTTAKILLMGDCSHLSVQGQEIKREIDENNPWISAAIIQEKSGRPNLEFLYLYRINALQLDANFDATLKQISVLYSNVNLTTHDAIEKYAVIDKRKTAHINRILITGSIVDTIEALAFALLQRVDSIIFNRTIVRDMSDHAFDHSQVKRVELWHSDLLAVGDMLEHVDEMRIEQSHIPHGQEITRKPSADVAFVALSAYELCVLRNSDRSRCQKCLENNSCEEYAKRNTTIIKRCAGSDDCDDTDYNERDIPNMEMIVISSANIPHIYECLMTCITGIVAINMCSYQ